MDYKDFFLGPLYFILIYFIAYSIRNKIVKDKSIRGYFIPALTLKLFGAITLGIIYEFYYKGGDTLNYYTYGSKIIWDTFLVNPSAGFHMIFGPICNYDNDYGQYLMQILYFCDSSSYFVIRVAGFLGLFTFNTYVAIAMFFALISFAGVWSMFTTLTTIYPQLKKQLVMACFLLPSVIFWGSGLMKDSLTFGCLGLFFTTFYKIFIVKKRSKGTILLFVLSFWVIKIVKIYIILCFIPAAALWLFMVYNEKIKSRTTRLLLRPVMVLIGCVFGYFAADYVSQEDERYSMTKLAQTAESTAYWLSYVSKVEKGSGYSLGEIEFTPWGMAKKVPAAINVTLFRPYLWEAKNIVMVLSALESLFFLYVTLITLYKAGLSKTYQIISQHPVVAASLVFSLTFAFAVGLSTANFGTLVRYKIPMMPFYLISVIVINHYAVKKKKEETNYLYRPMQVK